MTGGSRKTGPRVPYAERWANMTPDEKERIVGSAKAVDELDALLDNLETWPADTVAELTAETLARATQLAGDIRDVESTRSYLYDERKRVFVTAMLLGCQQARVAEAGGVTSMAVNFAIGGPVRATG